MRPGMRFGLSAIQKRDVWSRWKAGQTLHEIGRAYGKPHNSIRAVLLPRGGIPPVARRRSRLALTLAEREDISRGIASGSSIREIASRLDRAASTVSREVARHGGGPANRAHDADRQAWVSALRPKRCLLAVNRRLRDIVASKLILDWSPEQIRYGFGSDSARCFSLMTPDSEEFGYRGREFFAHKLWHPRQLGLFWRHI